MIGGVFLAKLKIQELGVHLHQSKQLIDQSRHQTKCVHAKDTPIWKVSHNTGAEGRAQSRKRHTIQVQKAETNLERHTIQVQQA